VELLILAVGRCREPALNALVDEYRRRCPWVVRVREVAAGGDTAAEAGRLLAALPEGAAVVALDGRGRDLSSEDFARRLGRWRDGEALLGVADRGAQELAGRPRHPAR
jgi:23S rRNA (pseudouridine1915-N3)-methyltransferase